MMDCLEAMTVFRLRFHASPGHARTCGTKQGRVCSHSSGARRRTFIACT
jgi:hypothetical protein